MQKSIIKWWPLIIFTFALGVRSIFLGQFLSYPFFYPDVEGLDPFLYHESAKCLAQGYWPQGALLYSHPFYPYIVSFFYSIFGVDSYFITVFQFLLGAFSSVLLFFIARYVFKEKAAVFGSFFAAIYAPIMFNEAMLVPSALAIFLNLSAIFVLVDTAKIHSLARTFLGGLLLGCSLATNSGIAPFIIIFIFWLAYLFKAQRKLLFGQIGCFVLALLLPLSLLSLKNYFVEGRFTTFAGHGGINFYIGNNPQAAGTFNAPFGFSPCAEKLSQESAAYAQKALGKDTTALEISSYWYKKAFSYIKGNPFKWFKLLLRKITLFYNGTEIGDVADFYFAKNYSTLLRFNPFTFRVVGTLGLAGMILALPRYFKKAFLLYAAIFGFMFSCMLFFVNARYRLSSVPFLIIFAGFAIYKILQIFKRRDFGRLGISIAVVILCFIFVNKKAIAIDTLTPVYNLSVQYAKGGLYDKSIAISQRLLNIKENNILSAVHFNLGLCYYRKNMHKEAVSEFEEALRINPHDYSAHFNLGVAY